MEIIVNIIFATLIYSVLLWLSSKVTGGGANFLSCSLVALISAVIVSLVPAILGIFIAGIVMIILLVAIAKVDFWPDAFLMVVVANLLGNITIAFTMAAFMKPAVAS